MNLKLQKNRSLSHLRTNRVHHFGLSEVPSHVQINWDNLAPYHVSPTRKQLTGAAIYDNNLTEQDILNLSDESDVGYILEVDLEYHSDFPEKHSDFSFAPENKPPPNCKEPRLLTSLEPKTKYVLHYSKLKLYLKLGRKATQLSMRKTTRLIRRNETTQLCRRKQLNSVPGTNQLNSAVETTQLSSRNETTQPCGAVDRLNRLYSRIGFSYLLLAILMIRGVQPK
ncbi:uncharacterized protein TNCV_4484961 [Trichonephila clavipes]|nr:uncharacterized protein TNCV_4484961 [Trichonephila clavipes]